MRGPPWGWCLKGCEVVWHPALSCQPGSPFSVARGRNSVAVALLLWALSSVPCALEAGWRARGSASHLAVSLARQSGPEGL